MFYTVNTTKLLIYYIGPIDADLALALLRARACSFSPATASASPRAPATLRNFARLRAAISSASSICFL